MGTIGTDLNEFELEKSVLTWRKHVGPESSKIYQIEKGFFNYTLYEKCNLMRLSKTTNVLKSSDKVQLQSVAKIASQPKQMKNAKNSVRQTVTLQRLSPLMI